VKKKEVRSKSRRGQSARKEKNGKADAPGQLHGKRSMIIAFMNTSKEKRHVVLKEDSLSHDQKKLTVFGFSHRERGEEDGHFPP